MKQTFEYINTGGFPFDVDKLADMQEAFSIFESIAHIAGDKVIITGCVEDAGEVSNGIIAINGFLFPFVGGPIGTEVGITTVLSTLPYEDGVSRNYKTLNTASFAVGSGIMWADFVRLESVRELMTNKLDKAIYDVFETTVTTFMDQIDNEYISILDWTSVPTIAPSVFTTNGWPGIIGTDFRKETGDSFSSSPSIRKHKTGFVQLKGTFNRNTISNPTFDSDFGYSDGSWYTLLHLPVGYRPGKTIIHVIEPNLLVKIMPTGDVRIYSTLGTDFIVFLNSIPMFWGN